MAAATSIIDDLAHGRVVGKELGERYVGGDLTGLARVKFDTPGTRPGRFRLVYRQVDQRTREIVAIGPRDEHAIHVARQPRLARLVKSGVLAARALDLDEARASGVTCGTAGTADVIDASVAILARRHRATVVTSDPGDIHRLDPGLTVVCGPTRPACGERKHQLTSGVASREGGIRTRGLSVPNAAGGGYRC